METLISKKFISEQGKVIQVRVEFGQCRFKVSITINNEYISQNETFTGYMREDQIYPQLEDSEKISEINNKLIELNSFISSTLKPDK